MEALPRVIDRYELLGVLGSGAFATVYRARHVHTQQAVAVKLLVGAPSVDKWLAEARAAAAVNHRNVVRVLDCGQAGGDAFIVMELADGPTLADVIAHAGQLTPQRAIDITLQILEGLAAAHACGIVHRDVKPANILLERDDLGRDLPKILDFGVSKQLTEMSSTREGVSIGTPGYMAPELFGGAKNADARADIYAVAVTLYEMLSGKLPFTAHTYEELVVLVATQRPEPLLAVAPHVPPAVAMAVDRALARERGSRFSTVREFAAALRDAPLASDTAPPSAFMPTIDVRTGDPTTLRTAPPPVVSTANRQETKSRSMLGWAVGIVSALLLLGTAGGVALWRTVHASATASEAMPSSAPLLLPSAATEDKPVAMPTPPRVTAEVAAAAPAVKASAGGVKFKFPAKVVGQAKATAIDALAQRIVPKAQRCRPEHDGAPIVARVQLFVNAEGFISIAQPASDPGDEDAASCLAALFKEAANPQTFSPGGGGIATVEARLEPLGGLRP